MTNRPSKRKQIAAAALALLCFSGFSSTEEQAKVITDFAEACRKDGGTAIIKGSMNNVSYIIPSFVDVTCSLPPSSAAGAKNSDKDGGAK